ncbi:MAG TPA: hypothetical protein VHM70_01920 [Polyangiaceae bacterium]|nr:hypothetical protein [Polyangiaceae bacterium]
MSLPCLTSSRIVRSRSSEGRLLGCLTAKARALAICANLVACSAKGQAHAAPRSDTAADSSSAPSSTTDADAGDSGPLASAGDSGGASVRIGVPSGPDGLDFAPLNDGDELGLRTFGQGGTHVFLGVQTRGLGQRAYVTVNLHNLNSDAEIEAPAPPRPQLFFCDDNHLLCDLVPITVMTGGLTDADEERDGLPIRIRIEVHNDAGAMAMDERRAVLSTADL